MGPKLPSIDSLWGRYYDFILLILLVSGLQQVSKEAAYAFSKQVNNKYISLRSQQGGAKPGYSFANVYYHLKRKSASIKSLNPGSKII